MTAGIPDFQITVRPDFPWPLLALAAGVILVAVFLRRPTWARWALLVLGVVLIVKALR